MNTLPNIFDYISLRELIIYSSSIIVTIILLIKITKRKSDSVIMAEFVKRFLPLVQLIIKDKNELGLNEIRFKKHIGLYKQEYFHQTEKLTAENMIDSFSKFILMPETLEFNKEISQYLDKIKERTLQIENLNNKNYLALDEIKERDTEIENLNAINKKLGDTIQNLEFEINNRYILIDNIFHKKNEVPLLIKKDNKEFILTYKECLPKNKSNKPKKLQRKKPN